MEHLENIEPEIIIPEFQVFNLSEHQSFSQQDSFVIGTGIDYSQYIPFLDSLTKRGVIFKETQYGKTPSYLGINNYSASYYIGACWLENKKNLINSESKAVVITPKMPNIDFISMFLSALEFSPSSEYFSKYYGISLDEPEIECDSLNNELTPLLITQFLFVLKKITSKGLKKDYIYREENLKSKIKGKLVIQKNLQMNTFQKREDRNFCKFQEYTIDIPENRLLKKALLFSQKALNTLSITATSSLSFLQSKINNQLSFFTQISDEIEPYELRNNRYNKMYKEYNEAISIAKMILKRFSYSIKEASVIQKKVPPFWIDMSRLYEVYVYSKLYKAYGKKIVFQKSGHAKTAVDFLKTDEGIILDTKYKPHYGDNYSGIIADIREMSGYARDRWITRLLKNRLENEEIPCVIIYPEKQILNKSVLSENEITDEDKNELSESFDEANKRWSDFSDTEFDSEKTILEQVNLEIPGFRNFYMLSVRLPLI